MVENEFAAFFRSSNSEGKSLEKKPTRFGTPSGGSFVTAGESEEDLNTSSSKRSRGRPKGSKIKHEPSADVIDDPQNYIEPIFIEIPAGNDVVKSIIKMAWRHQAHITVLRGVGLVYDISLHEPMSHASPIIIQGSFEMISLCGTYVNSNCDHVPSEFITDPAFSIRISGGNGQVFGGVVRGNLKDLNVVMIVATLLRKPVFYRMASLNGRDCEAEKVDVIHGGIINHDDDHPPHEHNTNKNIDVVTSYDLIGANSTHINHQVLVPPPIDELCHAVEPPHLY